MPQRDNIEKMAKRNTIAEYYNTYLSRKSTIVDKFSEGSENVLKLLIE